MLTSRHITYNRDADERYKEFKTKAKFPATRRSIYINLDVPQLRRQATRGPDFCTTPNL